jgi:hypothetical protein
MRVLHLIDSGVWSDGRGERLSRRPADQEAVACAALLRHAPVEQRVVLLGPAAAARRATRLGLHADVTICPPLGVPRLAWRTLRRLSVVRGDEVIHCWSESATGLVKLALGRDPTFIGASDLPPPFEMASCREADREAARAALGARRGTLVLAQLGVRADAVRFARIVGALTYAGVDVVGIAPSWAGNLTRGMSYARRFGRIRLVASGHPMREVLRAADLALWDPQGAAGGEPPALWSIAEAHAAGVPVAAARHEDVLGAYPESAVAPCLAFNSALPELARVILELAEDGALRARLSAAVREHIGRISGPAHAGAAAMRLWSGGTAAREPRLSGGERKKSVA